MRDAAEPCTVFWFRREEAGLGLIGTVDSDWKRLLDNR